MGNQVVHHISMPAGAALSAKDRAHLGMILGVVNAAGAAVGEKVTTTVAVAGLPANYAVQVTPTVGLRYAVNNKTATGFNVDLHPVLPTIPTPGAVTVTTSGATGATTYDYTVAALDDSGGVTAAGSAGITTSGNATLSTSNFNILSATAVPGAAQYAWYRTVGGATQGLIGVTPSPTLNDTGLAATTSAGVPSTSPSAASATVPAGTFDLTIIG